MHDKVFKCANTVYDGYMAAIRAEGKDTSESKPTIEPEDVHKLHQHVFMDSPQGLQYRVFFYLCMHFGCRGREGLRQLHKKSFVVETDGKGQKFVRKVYNELEKAKRGNKKNEKEKKPLMYEIPASSDCPIANYEKYIDHLNEDSDALFQRAKTKYDKTGV